MNILNIFNNLVTLSSLHSPTHTLSKQPQCSYKHNVYQHIAPASQGNPPMSTASEESSAGFLPEAPQIKRETGQQEPETGNRAAGIKCRRANDRAGRTGTGRKRRQPEDGIEKAGQRTSQSRVRTPKARNWTRKSENGQEKPGNRQGKSDAEEAGIPKVKRIGQGQKKETRNRDCTSVIHSFLTNLKLLT